MSVKLLGNPARAVRITAWVVAAFLGAQVLGSLLLVGLGLLVPSFAGLNSAVLSSVSAAVGYGLALAIAIGVPYYLYKRPTSLKTLGIQRSLSWSDIGFGILAFIPYAIVTALVIWLFSEVFKIIDIDQSQALPFENLVLKYEFVVAFITLVVVAPLAEELLFRGYFLGKMSETTNRWASVVITAVVFGLMHVPGFTNEGGFQLQWGAAADTFALGLVLGSLRIFTGSVWAGVLLHMVKNAIAYYILFIAPSVPGTM